MKQLSTTQGITLIEITVAIFILGVAAIPMIGLFIGYYDGATRQLEQDVALKIAESTLSVLMNTKYSDLAHGTIGTLEVEVTTEEGLHPIKLMFTKNKSEDAKIKIGRNTYDVKAQVEKVFEGFNFQTNKNAKTNCATFNYLDLRDSKPKTSQYKSFDDLLTLVVEVGYGGNVPIVLSSFRADMVR